MTGIPWLLPGVLIAIVVSLLVARRVGRQFGTSSLVGGSLVCSFGLILSATLTPQWSALEFGQQSGGTCDLTLRLPALAELLEPTDFSLNVLLFLPLGFTVGLVPRPSLKMALVAVALSLPFIVESTQFVLPALDRACQVNDIVANEVGLLLGLAIGWAVRRVRG